MVHADWQPIGLIKSLMTGHYTFSFRILDHSIENVKDYSQKLPNKKKILSDSKKHLPSKFYYPDENTSYFRDKNFLCAMSAKHLPLENKNASCWKISYNNNAI